MAREFPEPAELEPGQIPAVLGNLARYQAELQIAMLGALGLPPVNRIEPLEPLLPPEQAAAILGIKKKDLYERAKRGEIPGAHKRGKFWRFTVQGLKRATSVLGIAGTNRHNRERQAKMTGNGRT